MEGEGGGGGRGWRGEGGGGEEGEGGGGGMGEEEVGRRGEGGGSRQLMSVNWRDCANLGFDLCAGIVPVSINLLRPINHRHYVHVYNTVAAKMKLTCPSHSHL